MNDPSLPLLRDCLHQSVTMSEHVRVQCPFDDGEYQCEEFISDREIRTVSVSAHS